MAQETHLTEMILTIQHEVQVALDYIETVASEEASELGAAPSLLTVERLRIRVPLVFEPTEEIRPLEEGPEMPPRAIYAEEPQRLKERLLSRTGLHLKTEAGKIVFSKIRVVTPPMVRPAETTVGSEAPPQARPHVGEIELTFARVPRDVPASTAKISGQEE